MMTRCYPAMALALAALLCLGTGQALAQKVLRLAHLNPEGPFESHSGAMAAVFKSLVETATNGSVVVEVFPNGQLGKDAEVIQQVKDGVVQATISSAGGLAQHYPLVGVFDLPFAFPNIYVAHEVIDLESDFGQRFAADLEQKTGMKLVGLLDSGGFFAFTNSKQPIETMEDLAGLRIRTMTLPTHEAMIGALGGQPTPLAWAEVYTALQTKVVDGQMNPIPIIAFAKFDEVQRYLSITNHIITPYVFLLNGEFYQGLSDAERAVVDYAAAVAEDAGRGVSRVIEASEQGLPKLAQAMEVNAVPAAELEKFAREAQPAVQTLIEEKFGAEGKAMLEAMQASIEAVQAD
ncbi:MAG: DctP family TRAP transporter solute-binding subunit [Candidatus Competibacterales bacterium]